MAGVTIQELGLSFVKVCMEQYWGNWWFPLLFLLGLVWTLITHRKQAPVIFIFYTVFLALTVYNPYPVKIIIPKLDFENEYYRFFWILPLIHAVAYYGTRLVFSVKSGAGRLLAAAAAAAVILAAGIPLSGVAKDFSVAENLYKVPDDLRAVCDVIHSHSNEENPRVVFDNHLNHIARQYDPSLELVLNRNVVLYRLGSTVVGTYDENKPIVKMWMRIIDVVYLEKQRNCLGFKRALYRTKTDYLVIPVEHTMHDYFVQAGCEAIAQTEDYVVYYFDWENAYEENSSQ